MVSNIKVIPSGSVTSPQGFLAGAAYAGIKKKNLDTLDLAILKSAVPAAAAGVFTTNLVKAAPVVVSKNVLKSGRASAIVINSGCANACTGELGEQNAVETAHLAAEQLGISRDEVLVASTGVIGHQLPMEKISAGIQKIKPSSEGGHLLARAIMTTDTVPKEIAVSVTSGKTSFTIGGAAKGAGMIHPNMATMLSFITTDAAVDTAFLQKALARAADATFNMVSVDTDTSTNDSLIILANGLAGNTLINGKSSLAALFQKALYTVCLHLAKAIARDGEGATRLIEVTVKGAASLSSARRVAHTIISSPLVKTAVHGNDPNWGRILAAAGRSGAPVEEKKMDLSIGGVEIVKSGRPLEFDAKKVIEVLKGAEVPILLELNQGKASATAWGCDLSEEYVTINSDYTT